MGWPVVTMASGGLPVVDVTATTGRGTPVSEAANKFGCAVTKVTSGGIPVVFDAVSAVWSPTDISSNVTLSGGGLTATATGNAAVRATAGASAGKAYFETKMTVWLGANSGPGLALSTVALPWFNNTPGVVYVDGFGNIRINGATSGSALGTSNSNDVIGCAIDLGAKLVWFRKAPAGNWNGSGTANPATAVGGLSISAISGALFPSVMFTNSTEQSIANFGGSAFAGAVPSGFMSGWPP